MNKKTVKTFVNSINLTSTVHCFSVQQDKMDVFYNFIIIFSKKNDKMIYENNKKHEF